MPPVARAAFFCFLRSSTRRATQGRRCPAPFALAHLCYLAAFSADVRLGARPWPFVLYALAALAMHSGAVAALAGRLHDASLAFDRFHTPFAAATALVLATYWLAQGLIAASLWSRPAATARRVA